jgi:hypothetical protein
MRLIENLNSEQQQDEQRTRVRFGFDGNRAFLSGLGWVEPRESWMGHDLTHVEIDVNTVEFSGEYGMTLDAWVNASLVAKRDERYFLVLLEHEFEVIV